MAHVYIIHSKKADKFYTGFTTEEVDVRVERHNNGHYDDKFTAAGVPWILFLLIDCDSVEQARQIEGHIKRMKSKKYIENLRRYPEMIEKLRKRYS